MDILMYSLIFPPDVCSNAYVFADLADELQRRGHTVSVITMIPHYGGDGSGLTPGKKSWYRCGNYHGMRTYHICTAEKKGGTVRQLRRFAEFFYYGMKLLREESLTADVVLTQTPPPVLIASVCSRMAKMLHARSALVIQDMWTNDLHTEGKLSDGAFRAVNAIERKLYSQLDGIVTISPYMAEKVRQKINDDLPLAVIPNPVNCQLYHPVGDTETLRRKYDIGESDFVVSYVGNLGSAQDLRPLFRYAREHLNDGVVILIAGNGTCEDFVKTQSEGLPNVRFLGYVPREVTTELNAVSDVCTVMLDEVITATSFPSKLCTVMAMGRPVALSCRSDCALRAYFAENEIGFSTAVDAPETFCREMEKLRQDPVRRSLCGENAYRAAMRDFALPSIGEKYEVFFREIMKSE